MLVAPLVNIIGDTLIQELLIHKVPMVTLSRVREIILTRRISNPLVVTLTVIPELAVQAAGEKMETIMLLQS